MSLQNLVRESEIVLLSEFGFRPEKSKYAIHSGSEWPDFLRTNNSHPDSQGVYFPRRLSAHLKQDSEFLAVNLLHEYFGHGLYCEHSINGQKIVSLEQSLEETEKQMLGFEELPPSKCFKVNSMNPLFDVYKTQRAYLHEFVYQNIQNYEGFAMWLESFLSKATNQIQLFNQKMDELVHTDCRKLFEQFYDFSEDNGNFALIAQLGFPKYYSPGTIVDTLRRIYKKDFDSIKLCIIYGSQKPYSDIDLFIVSDKIQSAYNHWLDVYARTSIEFKYELDNLSIAITTPLFSGKTIIGNPERQKQMQQIVLNKPITQEAIQFNIEQSENQGKVALMYPEGSKERRIAKSYQQSFRMNAKSLQKGNKILTLR